MKIEIFISRTILICLLLIMGCFYAAAKIKCHDCMDTEKGWCRETTCEDEYCYKANATFNGKRILKLGCMPSGKIGCERQHVHFPAIADAAGDFCVCRTDFCNAALPAYAFNPSDANYTLLDYFSSAKRSDFNYFVCLGLGMIVIFLL